MTRRLLTLLVIASLALMGCKRDGGNAATSGGHGVPGAVAGSHDDWCGEHAVPESQCTRCNRALIPAFKATRDWCPEHGLPESQCLACNPSLRIERPAKRGGGR